MKREIVEKLEIIMDNHSEEDFRIDHDYSARYSYGRTTSAIVAPNIGCILSSIADHIESTDMTVDESAEIAEILRCVSGAHTDNMGRDLIFY